MMHHRTYGVVKYEEIDRMARDLCFYTWTLCMGAECYVDGRRVLLLNDSTSPDGAQEYAVVVELDGRLVQVESFTVSWMKPEQVVRCLKETMESVAEGKAPMMGEFKGKLQTAAEHGRCYLCA